MKLLSLTIVGIAVFLFGYMPTIQAAGIEERSSLPKVFDAPDISVSIPGLDKFDPVTCEGDICSIPWLAQYIAALQRYAIAIVAIIAVVAMMVGGVIWLTSAGEANRVGEAQKWIKGGLLGLLLVFASYVILYTINPELTILRSIDIKYISREDLPEVQVDTEELNKNIEETKAGGKVQVGNYCGCFNYKTSKSTTKLNTAQSINEAIEYLSPSSPLKGKGQAILDAANKFGFDPAIFVAKAKQENGLGTANSTIVRNMKNLASISCSSKSSVGSVSQTSGCKAFKCAAAKNGRLWRSYSTWEESIEDYFCFMKNSKIMGPSTSLRELITKYCPPCTYKGKCDCNTADYIDTVASIMQKYNNSSFDSDKPNGNNCNCYDMVQHCKKAGEKYCTNYGQ